MAEYTGGQIEAPENLTWEQFEKRALVEPVIAVYRTHERLGHISREAAAIGAALTLSRQGEMYRQELIKRRENEPPGLDQVRSFLRACIDFGGTLPSARENAQRALELLDELTRRRGEMARAIELLDGVNVAVQP